MDIFVARQPIFDTDGRVFAYELLFRAGWENHFPAIDPDTASAHTLANSLVTLGLDTLAGSRRVFINFTRRLLLSGAATLLPPQKAVIEVLETVDPTDPDVLEVCRDLKRRGYRLALDDFILEENGLELAHMADIIKIDFRQSSPRQRREIVSRLGNGNKEFLAEKVETRDDMEEATRLGARYLQGFFYCRPNIVAGRSIDAFKVNYLRLLRELHQSDFDIDHLENLFKHDLSLSYGLLKLINSAAFALRNRIESIRQALVLLGQNRVRKWVSLVVLSEMATDKPQELVIQSVVRAYFCELIAERTGRGAQRDDYFLMGMFSMIDAILDQPLSDALKRLPLAEEIKKALLKGEGELSLALRLVHHYERADWGALPACASKIGLAEDEVPPLYQEAIGFVESIQR